MKAEMINVYEISISDNSAKYYERDLENVKDTLEDMGIDSTYIIALRKMLKSDYDNLGEFTGF